MKTRQVTKLFAVMAIAASPAVADPARHAPVAVARPAPGQAVPATPDPHRGPAHVATGDQARRPAFADPWASPASVAARPPAAAAPGSLLGLLGISTARPRTLPSGAPACGNVASRAAPPIDCGRGTRP